MRWPVLAHAISERRLVALERVWIKFDGLSAVEGLVCWIEGFVAGIEFVRAIHEAVFDSLMPRLR